MATYNGSAGNDSVYAGSGSDVINANGGNDTVQAYGGNDVVFGGAGADSVFGGAGDDTLNGDAGNDTLQGDAGYDVQYGGAGDDRLIGGNDIYDDFYGGDGNDTILAGDYDADWAWGGAGADVVSMGAGADMAWGGSGADTVFGGLGADTVQGGVSNDSVAGDAGADLVLGGAGADTVSGGADNDTVMGGSGSDLLQGGSGDDLIRGDSDSWTGFDASTGPVDTTLTLQNAAAFAVDVYWIDSSGGAQFYVTLSPGQSWTTSTGSTHNWFLTEVGASNPIEVIYGAPAQTVVFSPPFDDTISGGDGHDTIYGDYGHDSIMGDAGNDLLFTGTGNDTVMGGAGDDSAALGAGDDRFGDWGGLEAGNDTVDAGAGQDSLNGGSGNDLLFGGDGNDWLTGADGADQLFGGSGNDIFAISDDHQGDTITGGENAGDLDSIAFASGTSTQGIAVTFTGNESGSYDFLGTDGAGSFTQIEQIHGTAYGDSLNASATDSGTALFAGAGADTLIGGAGADSLYGGDGHDTVFFGAGADQVFGGDGNDLMDDVAGGILGGNNLLDGGAGDDTLWAGDGSDTVLGGLGNDQIMAEAGDDAAAGGEGTDSLWGGTGRDTLDGGAGDDLIWGDDGHDVLSGADGADRLFGGHGNDSLSGGAGNDTLSGGDGNDVMQGGLGHDVFDIVEAGAGDTILDFDMSLVSGLTTDRLDVSALRNADGSPVKLWDVVVTEDGNGDSLLTFPEGESLLLKGVAPALVTAPGMLAAMGVPCFVADSLIDTPEGPQRVQRLRPGDLVCLRGGGTAPVLWAGGRSVTAAMLRARPELRPIRLHLAKADLLLSPQHAVMIRVPELGRALIRAGHLAHLGWGARHEPARGPVHYHHLLLPRHALILAQGLACESFYPGPVALAALAPEQRKAVAVALGLRPALGVAACLTNAYGPRCLPLLTLAQARRWHAAAQTETGHAGNRRCLSGKSSLTTTP